MPNRGKHAEVPYTWNNDILVEEVTDLDELKILCDRFIFEVKKFERGQIEGGVWKDQKRLAKLAASGIAVTAANERARVNCRFYMYKPLGKPVGLMSFTKSSFGDPTVWEFAMLPGRESEGTVLVEHAVNLSEAAGYKGRVDFPSVESTGWSFRPPWHQWGIQSRYLDPSKSDEWIKADGIWRLRKYIPWQQLTIGRETFGSMRRQPRRWIAT